MIYPLNSAATANGTSATVTPPLTARDGLGLYQASITGTATVTLQGRLVPSAPWADIVSLTSSGAQSVALFPFMQSVVSGVSGTVSVSDWLGD